MCENIARVEFVGISFPRKNHSGFERARLAGSSVSRKMKIRIALRIAAEVRRGGRLLSLQYLATGIRKILFNLRHFRRCLRERGEISVWLLGVTHEEQALLFPHRSHSGTL